MLTARTQKDYYDSKAAFLKNISPELFTLAIIPVSLSVGFIALYLYADIFVLRPFSFSICRHAAFKFVWSQWFHQFGFFYARGLSYGKILVDDSGNHYHERGWFYAQEFLGAHRSSFQTKWNTAHSYYDTDTFLAMMTFGNSRMLISSWRLSCSSVFSFNSQKETEEQNVVHSNSADLNQKGILLLTLFIPKIVEQHITGSFVEIPFKKKNLKIFQ